MDFTREPIIETVITPREGCKLVVRSSKGPGQEEFFVDALEVVSFGNSFFFRSLERPKSFIVPSSDYEVLEVREARMVLKNVGTDRTIKIAGGRETPPRHKEPAPAKIAEEAKPAEKESATKVDKKRDRRRSYRKRRGRREDGSAETEQEEHVDLPTPGVAEEERLEDLQSGTSIVTTLLPPPPTLISESLQRYKRMEFFPEEEDTIGSPEDEESHSFSEDEIRQPSFEDEEVMHTSIVERDTFEEFEEEAPIADEQVAVEPEDDKKE